MKNMLIVALCLTAGQWATADSLQARWKWSEKQTELYQPSFSADGREIVVVRKAHEPDGHEAESFTEKELAAFRERVKTQPRWGDPAVSVFKIGDAAIEDIGYGWNAAFSPDGKSVVFASQKKPISGLRVLAATLAGNEIVTYDRRTRQAMTLAHPQAGHLDKPLYSPDGARIAYMLADAVNGDYPGHVGIGVVDLNSKTAVTWLGPEKPSSPLSVVDSLAWAKDGLAMIHRHPATGPDAWGSTVVDIVALSAPSKIRVVHSWDAQGLEASLSAPSFAVLGDGTILFFDAGWVKVDPQTGKIIQEFGGTESPHAGTLSPDGKILAHTVGVELALETVGQKSEPTVWRGQGKINDMRWSPDGKHIAVIVTHETPKGDDDVFDRDELVVLDLL